MNKKELIVIVILYILAAIVINVSYSKIVENIAFIFPTIITGIAGFQCLTMKHLEKSEKIYAIILIALFIVFLYFIAPYNDIPAATYVYNHIGTVIIIGIILIGLVFYVDSERTKSYKKGAFEESIKLNKEIDELKKECDKKYERFK